MHNMSTFTCFYYKYGNLQRVLATCTYSCCAFAVCRDLHKEVVAGIDEAMARHAQETDKVDLLTLKKLKGRVNVLEQQIVTDKAKQLTVSRLPPEQCIWAQLYPRSGLYELPVRAANTCSDMPNHVLMLGARPDVLWLQTAASGFGMQTQVRTHNFYICYVQAVSLWATTCGVLFSCQATALADTMKW